MTERIRVCHQDRFFSSFLCLSSWVEDTCQTDSLKYFLSTASRTLYWKGTRPYATKRIRSLNKTKCLIKNVKWTAEGQVGHIWPEGSKYIPIKKGSIKSPGGELKTYVMEITSFRAPLPEFLQACLMSFRLKMQAREPALLSNAWSNLS